MMFDLMFLENIVFSRGNKLVFSRGLVKTIFKIFMTWRK